MTGRLVHSQIGAHPMLARMANEVDGFSHAQQVAVDARALLKQIEDPAPVRSPLDSGEPVTLEWLDAAAGYAAQADSAQHRRKMLFDLANQAESHAGALVAGAATDMLKRLDLELRGVMEKAAESIEELSGARDAAAAIKAGDTAANAWRKLTALADSIADIRSAQTSIMVWFHPDRIPPSRSQFTDDELASDLMLRNLDDVWSGWRQSPPNQFVVSGSSPRLEPWPVDPVGQLVWIVTSAAEAWVPTPAQLDKLHRQRAEAYALADAERRAKERNEIFDERKYKQRTRGLVF